MDPTPTIGQIVVYRNRAGVDLPAIITALTRDPGYVHLTQFPPPGHGPDQLSHEHGVPQAHPGEPDDMLRAHWRWPEIKP